MSAVILDFPKIGNLRAVPRALDENLTQRLMDVIQAAVAEHGRKWLSRQDLDAMVSELLDLSVVQTK